MSKMENGVTYTDWTRIKVKMQELTVDAIDTAALGWTLEFRALTPAINGDNGGNLNLRTLRLSSSDASPGANAPKLTTTIPLTQLTTGAQTLAGAIGGDLPNTITPGDPDETTINVTYSCGGEAAFRIMGQPADLYTVDIELLLTVP